MFGQAFGARLFAAVAVVLLVDAVKLEQLLRVVAERQACLR